MEHLDHVSLNYWTLCFQDARMECKFGRSRSIVPISLSASLAGIVTVLSLVDHVFFIYAAVGGAEEQAVSLIYLISAIILTGCLATLLSLSCSCRWSLCSEVGVVALMHLIIMTDSLKVIQSKYGDMLTEHTVLGHMDLHFLLMLSSAITAIQPIRWCFAWTLYILVLLLYVAGVLGNTGSPHAVFSIMMFTLLLILTITWKRRFEMLERMKFQSDIQMRWLKTQMVENVHENFAGNLRASSEFLVGVSPLNGTPTHHEGEILAKMLLKIDGLELVPTRVLGRGDFGMVAEGCLHGTPVAVKVSRQTFTMEGLNELLPFVHLRLQSFLRVRHPNIALFHGITEVKLDPKRHCLALVFEKADGMPLEAFLKGPSGVEPNTYDFENEPAWEQPSLSTRYLVVLGVCRALAYLHAQNPRIMHGSLKASKIFVQKTALGPCAKLTDCGISKVFAKKERRSKEPQSWSPPEAANGGINAGPPADVYAFGLVTYYTMTGYEPFILLTKEKSQKLRKGHRVPALVWPADLLQVTQCQALVESCLRYDALTRPSMSAIRKELAEWCRQPELLNGSNQEANALVRAGRMLAGTHSCPEIVAFTQGIQQLHAHATESEKTCQTRCSSRGRRRLSRSNRSNRQDQSAASVSASRPLVASDAASGDAEILSVMMSSLKDFTETLAGVHQCKDPAVKLPAGWLVLPPPTFVTEMPLAVENKVLAMVPPSAASSRCKNHALRLSRALVVALERAAKRGAILEDDVSSITAPANMVALATIVESTKEDDDDSSISAQSSHPSSRVSIDRTHTASSQPPNTIDVAEVYLLVRFSVHLLAKAVQELTPESPEHTCSNTPELAAIRLLAQRIVSILQKIASAVDGSLVSLVVPSGPSGSCSASSGRRIIFVLLGDTASTFIWCAARAQCLLPRKEVSALHDMVLDYLLRCNVPKRAIASSVRYSTYLLGLGVVSDVCDELDQSRLQVPGPALILAAVLSNLACALHIRGDSEETCREMRESALENIKGLPTPRPAWVEELEDMLPDFGKCRKSSL